MKIYQGEPIGFKFNIKQDDNTYYPSLEGFKFEALLADSCGKVVKKWSTRDNSIFFGVETVDGQPRGYAAFYASGRDTAGFEVGEYIYEMAHVLGNHEGRAIGKLKGKIFVEFSLIRRGV